jgi:DNA-binding Lrp family transcriptional regulator
VVVSAEGSYDLVVVMLVKQINDMYGFWKDTLMRFGDFFVERVFSVYVEDNIYPFSFLLDIDEDRVKRVHLSRGERKECDEVDFGILKMLAFDPRVSSVDIAEGLGISTSVVGYRIKKLVESGIINFFSLLIDFSKIGYAGFKVDIFLKEFSRYNEIVKFVEKNPSLMAINCSLGYVDLELELILRDLKELHEFLEEITQRFPDVIRSYSYFRAIESHKFLLLDLEQL